MNKINSQIPDKLFGKDVSILKVWVMPLSIILALIVVFGVVVMPRVDQISNLLGQINKVNGEIKLLNDKRTYLLSLNQEELQAKSVLVENGVLSERNSYLLVKIIGKVVSEFGFSVSDFSVTLGDVKEINKVVTKFDYQKVPVEVVISGPKSNYLAMVSRIEKSLPVLSIDNFSMVSTGELATIKMSVSAYFSPESTQSKLDSLSVTDLTPTADEAGVLTKIGEYKYYGAQEVELNKTEQKFVPTNRIDPFF